MYKVSIHIVKRTVLHDQVYGVYCIITGKNNNFRVDLNFTLHDHVKSGKAPVKPLTLVNNNLIMIFL